MADQQPPAPAQAMPHVVRVEGLGYITIPPGQTAEQAVAEAQARRQQQMPGLEAGGHRLGLNMPDPGQLDDAHRQTFGAGMEQALSAMPELAAFLTQLTPMGKGAGALTSLTVPPITRAITNLIQGKPWDEGTLGEMAMGGATYAPTALAGVAANKGIKMNREALFSQTPIEDISKHAEDALPALAQEMCARPTTAGVERAQRQMVPAFDAATDLHGQIKSYTDVGYDPPSTLAAASEQANTRFADMTDLTNKLEQLRKHTSIRGVKGGPTAVLPGSGAVTTATRATGLPSAIGQIASPAVAAMKGSPARRMAVGQNLVRPGNLANMTDMGEGVSQILRLLEAYAKANGGIAPVASHESTQPERRPY